MRMSRYRPILIYGITTAVASEVREVMVLREET